MGPNHSLYCNRPSSTINTMGSHLPCNTDSPDNVVKRKKSRGSSPLLCLIMPRSSVESKAHYSPWPNFPFNLSNSFLFCCSTTVVKLSLKQLLKGGTVAL